VGAVLLALRGSHRFGRGTLGVLTWGGLRGGISIALDLALPEGVLRSTLLTATYAVVLFTLLVQAPTLGWVIRASIGPRPSVK
jgi:CPA1 family monovalent cation:H+ antiporter